MPYHRLFAIPTLVAWGLFGLGLAGMGGGTAHAADPVLKTAPASKKAGAVQSAPVRAHSLTPDVVLTQVRVTPAPKPGGKDTLKVTVQNKTKQKLTGVGVKVTYSKRVLGKHTFKRGLAPGAQGRHRFALTRPKARARVCYTAQLTAPRGSKLRLGSKKQGCLPTSVIVRGIDTSPRTGKGAKRPGAVFAAEQLTLKVNNKEGTVTVNTGESIAVSWTHKRRASQNGVYLLISSVSGTEGQCSVPTPSQSTSFISSDEGFKPNNLSPKNGNHTLTDFSHFTAPGTYYIKACAWNRGANEPWAGIVSNVVTVRYLPVTPTAYNVYIAVTQLDVHDDGDNISPGDWRVTLSGRRTTESAPQSTGATWPSSSSGSVNVNSGRTYHPNLWVKLTDIKSDESLRIEYLVVDCDGSFVIGQILAGVVGKCGGEEWYEVSGWMDYINWKEFVITPAEWQAGKTFSRRYTENGLDVTSHFEVGLTPVPVSGGGGRLSDPDEPPTHRK